MAYCAHGFGSVPSYLISLRRFVDDEVTLTVCFAFGYFSPPRLRYHADLPVQAKLLAADTKAEIMRARVMEQERERAEQNTKAAATAMVGKACALLEDFVARNKRMADRVAVLRAGVEVRVCSLGWLYTSQG